MEAEIQGSTALLFAVLMAGLMAIARRSALRHENRDTLRGILDLLASGSSLSLWPRTDRILITLLAWRCGRWEASKTQPNVRVSQVMEKIVGKDLNKSKINQSVGY